MYGFVEIEPDKFQLFPGQKILKAQEYMSYLAAIELVKAAQAKGDGIIASANVVYEDEKRRGYDDGVELSKQESAKEIQNTIAKCNNYYLTAEKTITDVVFDAVRKILTDFDDLELTLKVVQEALGTVSNQNQVTLHVHPDHVAEVRKRIDDILSGFPEIGYLDVMGDSRLKFGGCILVTEIGIVDASVDGQLKSLKKAIQHQFEKNRMSMEGVDDAYKPGIDDNESILSSAKNNADNVGFDEDGVGLSYNGTSSPD